MIYTETFPSEKVSELVHNYWKFEISADFNDGQPFLFEAMPENTRSIVFINHPNYNTITCLAPLTHRMKREVMPGTTYLGIRFNPWVTIEGLFDDGNINQSPPNEPLHQIQNVFSEFDFSQKSGVPDYPYIENRLSKLTNYFNITSDPLVKYICLQLNSGNKINDLIKDIPLSIRPIQKQFKKITGMTMTEFRNINKLRKTVRMIYFTQKSISHAAFENGYTDHAHFMNTFKKLMLGSSLKEFLTQNEIIRHQLPN